MGWKIFEFECAFCWRRFEMLEKEPVPRVIDCVFCWATDGAARVISAPMVQQHSGNALFSVTRGKSEPPPR